MKSLLTFLLSITLLSQVFAFTVHTSYDASSDYALGDIVPSSDANVLFYQAKQALTGGSHSLSTTTQWLAVVSSDIPNSGNAPSESVPDSAPTEAAPTTTPPDAVSEATLSNLSTRGYVGTGDSQMIAGFIVTGTGTTTVTIRALGPTIAAAPYNVAGTISDPSLTIVDGTGSVVASNDNWADYPSASEIQSDGRSPSNASEAVVRISVTPGNYTAIVSGAGGVTGVALVEVYDEATGGSSIELGNLSTRAFVGTGDSQMIAGFIVAGDTGSTSTVTIRALGPTIAAAPYNVSGTIADPFLTIVDGTGSVVASVDNWESSTSASAISSSGRNPGNTVESAHQLSVSPGNYTAIISGAGGVTGVSLVEVYKE